MQPEIITKAQRVKDLTIALSPSITNEGGEVIAALALKDTQIAALTQTVREHEAQLSQLNTLLDQIISSLDQIGSSIQGIVNV